MYRCQECNSTEDSNGNCACPPDGFTRTDYDDMQTYIAELEGDRDRLASEVEILRRLESAVFSGDALACSPAVPPILDEYLAWCREHGAGQ